MVPGLFLIPAFLLSAVGVHELNKPAVDCNCVKPVVEQSKTDYSKTPFELDGGIAVQGVKVDYYFLADDEK